MFTVRLCLLVTLEVIAFKSHQHDELIQDNINKDTKLDREKLLKPKSKTEIQATKKSWQ